MDKKGNSYDYRAEGFLPKNSEQRICPTYVSRLHSVHNSSEIFHVYVNYIAHEKTSEYFSIQIQVHAR